ncbi:hypothetical protein SAMD00019534_088530 [Acytostelium subglobosum LB1]|uniref:hypothetical protein n=1 Tax=Acytostelium subglobosum LB1 TaxID=1410327 RepID=UPI0006449697|nr:hypothetical protein SAMD00019534_088530 [Acytostelium subglobosum LB1]GAM25678.1 hypothetical protein SAMD00019534_088530 [Acytostelium subglobosum LB1]|eukprot:XP_012751196.1 hypothetical protein SAMD00019534_088530 [Acytostelium subglobosum LB1]
MSLSNPSPTLGGANGRPRRSVKPVDRFGVSDNTAYPDDLALSTTEEEGSGSDSDWNDDSDDNYISKSHDDDDHVSETDYDATPTKKRKQASGPNSNKKSNGVVPEKKKKKQQSPETNKKIKKESSAGGSSSKFGTSPDMKKKKKNIVMPQSQIDTTSQWVTKAVKPSNNNATDDRNFSFTRTNSTGSSVGGGGGGGGPNRLASIRTVGQKDFFQQFLFKPKADTIDLLDDDDDFSSSSKTTQSTAAISPKRTPTSNIVRTTDPSPRRREGEEQKEQSPNIEVPVDDEELPVVNRKRVHKPLFNNTPPKKNQQINKQVISIDIDELIFDDDDDDVNDKKKMEDEDDQSTEEEKEVERHAKQARKSFVKQSKVTDVDVDVDVDNDHSVDGGAIMEDDQATEDENDYRIMQDVDSVEFDDGISQLQKLIKACEMFSERMLKILSGFEDPNGATTTHDVEHQTKASHSITKQPSIINKSMRSYQLIGLNWMSILYKENISGILADEMGLGKTVQSISLLAHIYERYKDTGPHLIIVPATTYYNWQRELAMWCPTLKVYQYYGTQKEREYQRYELRKMKPGVDFNVIITTYNLMYNSKDRAFLKRYNYTYQVLDEAQNIKNSDSKKYKNLYKFQAKHKLLLTGTPLQNNIQELWSLLNFLMPHIFGKVKNNEMLEELMGSNEKNQVIAKMKKILAPFILRRLKTEVSLELKPKQEHIELITMSESQKVFYDQLITDNRAKWERRQEIRAREKRRQVAMRKKRSKINKTKSKKKKGEDEDIDVDEEEEEEDFSIDVDKQDTYVGNDGYLSNLLMQLRKIANHPLLCQKFFYTDDQLTKIKKILRHNDNEYSDYSPADMDELFSGLSDYHVHCIAKNQEKNLLDKYVIPDDQLVHSSSKCVKMNEIIAKNKEHSKILIFSQMTQVLDILEEVLAIQDISFCRLDGQTPVTERQDIIDLFSSDDTIPVFLLSTLAGGLGINLTCANVVIFYDLSFNPQVDRQAEDRAHRIGQTKDVYVHKLIVDESVDTTILEMCTNKKELNDTVLEEGSYETNAMDGDSDDDGGSSNKLTTGKTESKRITKLLTSIFSTTSAAK